MTDLLNARSLLERHGFIVLRRKSHEHTLRELDRARNALGFAEREVESAHRWASGCHTEERRLSDRLNAVCTAAAALGVPITDINAALAAADSKDS